MNSPNRSFADPNWFFADYCGILYRHKGKMFLFFLLGMTLVTFGIGISSRKYSSEARLHVRLGRESVALDPTATTGQLVGAAQPRKQEINTVKDLLRSRANIEAVVDRLGPDVILGADESANNDTKSDPFADVVGSLAVRFREFLLEINVADQVSLRERAIRRLSKDISIDSGEESNVISIVCLARTPQFAQRIANEFLQASRAGHVDAHSTQGSFDFFEDQTQQQREELETAENKLRDIKSQNGIVTIPAQQDVLKNEIAFVETELLKTRAELAASKARIISLEESMRLLPELLVTEEKTESSDSADQMRRVLYELEIQEKQLAATYTSNHTLLIAVRKQVEASKKLLETEEKLRVQPTRQLNPARQQQSLSLLDEQSFAAAHEAKLIALNRQFSELQEKLHKLSVQEVLVAQLVRQVELSRENFLDYSRKYEQARINGELERLLISNLNVVQPPNFVEKPVQPRKLVVLLLGFAASTVGAIGLAFLCQYYRDYRAYRNSQQASDVRVGNVDLADHPSLGANDANLTRISNESQINEGADLRLADGAHGSNTNGPQERNISRRERQAARRQRRNVKR